MNRLMSKKAAVFCFLVALSLCASFSIAVADNTNAPTAAEVRQEISEALQSISSYSAEQRDLALAKAKDSLERTDTHIEQLQKQFDQHWQQMSQEARKEARETLKSLQQQRTEIAEWYGGLKHSSSNAWEEIKKGFSASYTELGKSLEKARKEF
ncbi:MAG: hypothetical protein OQL18_05720 [Deltaproteobacteria bacterium]|jgi:molecular chaperone DnaK (HSP70)|nr:hypothetical protein [Deltaproteobacteria bacterium]